MRHWNNEKEAKIQIIFAFTFDSVAFHTAANRCNANFETIIECISVILSIEKQLRTSTNSRSSFFLTVAWLSNMQFFILPVRHFDPKWQLTIEIHRL